MTDRLPGIVDLARSLPATALVLDGEAVGVGEDEAPRAFQDTMSAFGREDGVAGAGLQSRPTCCTSTARIPVDRPRPTSFGAAGPGPWIPGVITWTTSRPSAARRALAGARADGQGRSSSIEERLARHVGVAQGQAGTRSTWWCWPSSGAAGGAGLAVQPSPAAPATPRALRHGGQDVQGPPTSCSPGRPSSSSIATDRGDWVVTVRPEQVVEIALDGVSNSIDPSAWPCASPGSGATATTRTRRGRHHRRGAAMLH